ncbi:hypothetical protein DPMN_005404 [Dreissena polymorpha]|uniref:Uncharacterized protein n=1 Tax=Dreissena polymorpha TaxID=45954 RepID=A0A9D4MQ70_DREPO|nr:hypothetical protein DPMN_005404 [Dreissena polymorpha]
MKQAHSVPHHQKAWNNIMPESLTTSANSRNTTAVITVVITPSNIMPPGSTITSTKPRNTTMVINPNTPTPTQDMHQDARSLLLLILQKHILVNIPQYLQELH